MALETVISAIKSVSHKTRLLQIHAHIIRTTLIQYPTVSLQFLSRIALSGPLQDASYSQRETLTKFYQMPKVFFIQINNQYL